MTIMDSGSSSRNDDGVIIRVNDKNGNDNNNNESSDDDDDDEDDEYKSLVQSIRSPSGLEVGVRVTWPFTQLQFLSKETEDNCNEERQHHGDQNDNDNDSIVVLNLSTCLPPTEMAPMFHGTQWAGTRVWRAAIVTLQYLLCTNNNNNNNTTTNSSNNTSPLHEIISSKRRRQQQQVQQQKVYPIRIDILELGCGLGVPGMILQKCLGRHNNYDCNVVLTDKSSLVEQLRQNIAANFINQKQDTETQINDHDDINNQSTSRCTSSPRIQAHELDWSDAQSIHSLIHQTTTATGQSSLNDDDHEDHDTKASTTTGEEEEANAAAAATTTSGFDLVFNCDCIYEHLYGRESWQALLQCQQVLLQHKPNTICITAVERRNGDGVDAYLEACAASEYISRVERITLALPIQQRQVDDDDDDDDAKNDAHEYWAKHPPPPEVEIYRAHGHV